MDQIRIALIGYGNVGQAFARMLERRREYIRETFDTDPVVTAICTRSKGGILQPAGAGGIDTARVTDDMFDKSIDAIKIIDFGEYDVMIELTPINIMTGMPATRHVERALQRGKHVITANKGPIAWAYRELRDKAEENGVQFLYEATVMDGVPVYNLTRETMMGCRITEVSGIFNATTNFILTEMEKGIDFEEAVEEGRRQGFVEADPAMDVDGWDAAAKLTALMNVLMDVQITPTEIDREGIGHITKEDLDAAAEQGKKIKLLCQGRMEEDGDTGILKPVGSVKPTLVDQDSLPAIMDATSSYVSIMTDLMGGVTVIEEPFEPEIDHTAYGVLSDLLRILNDTKIK